MIEVGMILHSLHMWTLRAMADNAHANWNVVRKVDNDGDPTIPLEGCDCTCLFHWSANLDKIRQKCI